MKKFCDEMNRFLKQHSLFIQKITDMLQHVIWTMLIMYDFLKFCSRNLNLHDKLYYNSDIIGGSIHWLYKRVRHFFFLITHINLLYTYLHIYRHIYYTYMHEKLHYNCDIIWGCIHWFYKYKKMLLLGSISDLDLDILITRGCGGKWFNVYWTFSQLKIVILFYSFQNDFIFRTRGLSKKFRERLFILKMFSVNFFMRWIVY